jgi:hypothetical protein
LILKILFLQKSRHFHGFPGASGGRFTDSKGLIWRINGESHGIFLFLIFRFLGACKTAAKSPVADSFFPFPDHGTSMRQKPVMIGKLRENIWRVDSASCEEFGPVGA